MRLAQRGLMLLLLLAGCSDFRERRRLASAMAEVGAAVARRDSAAAARLLYGPEMAGMLLRADSADPHLIRDLGATLRIREADYFGQGALIFGDFQHCSAREQISIRFERVDHVWRIARFQMDDRDLSGLEDACGHPF